MSHVVLLGDSIFDNARYVPGGPEVIEQLRRQLPSGWRSMLLARDGAVAADVQRQLVGLPPDASHLVISAGGNNALEHSALLREESLRATEGFGGLAAAQGEFRREYREMLRAVLASAIPVSVCTVYDTVPGLSPAEITALSVFNDVIQREAFRAGVPVLDLRLICDEARDYSALSPIEPSAHGGFKIVQGIARIVTSHDFGARYSVVYGK
jgi:hypothetical protein